MLYDIRLHITYSFGKYAASGHQLLRVMPKELPGLQRVIAATLDFRPRPSTRLEGLDFFRNAMVEATFQNVWSELEFTVQARVKREAKPKAMDFSPQLDHLAGEIERYTRLDPASPHHFTGFSPRISKDAAIERYAREQIRPNATVLETVLAISKALHDDMQFDAEATDVNTPAGLAFKHRRGVCQDFAHIMITALRMIGIPAGYVSGFLRTIPPEGKERLEGADAMHAWVSAWCGSEVGWVELDPTNGVLADMDHIVIAVGRDYNDVSPVKGILKTAGAQETEQAVDVIAVPET